MKNWFTQKQKLGSNLIQAEQVIRVTEKAIQISGYAMIKPSTVCCNCGRTLTDPVSIELGIGPICAGIDQRDSMSQSEKDEYVRQFSRTHAIMNMWVPKSVIENMNEITLVPDAKVESVKEDKKQADVVAIIFKERICVKSLYEYADLCKSIPGGKWEPTKKFWHYPVNDGTAYQICKAFENVSSKSIAQEIIDAAEKFSAAQEIKVTDNLGEIPNTIRTPWLHQLRAFWFAKSLSGAFLAMDMGTGKTKVAVDLVMNDDDHKVLIICPQKVIKVWPKEFAKDSDGTMPVFKLDSGTSGDKALLAEEIFTENEDCVIVCNYESAWRNPIEEEYKDRSGKKRKKITGYSGLAGWILSKQWDRIILDESHKIKQFDGKAATFCHKLEEVAKRRNCLTGTPSPNNPLDIWSQCRFVDSSVFGKSWWSFRNRYAIMGGYMNKQIVGYQNMDELNRKFYSIAYRVMSEDVQDLPELLHIPMSVELSAKARRIYKAAEDEMYVAIGDAKASTTIVLTKLLRCQQIAAGYLPTDQGEIKVDNNKVEMLEELIDDINPEDSVVVVCRFKHDLKEVAEVAKKLGRTYGEISGESTSGLSEQATLQDGIQICGLQIQAGGVGIDLTKAHYVICFSVGWSLGDYEQMIKRFHRPGQENKVKVYHIIAEDTVDEKVYAGLTSKKKIVDVFLNGE